MALMIHAVVGEIEVTAPADILDHEIERAPGETDEEFAVTAAAYERLFRAAVSAARRTCRPPSPPPGWPRSRGSSAAAGNVP